MDRLTPSAAIGIVSRLVGLFPNGGQSAGDEYIAGLARILANYPRSVAARAADPISGVARETEFLPTPAVLIAWCERETAPMAEDYAAAKRIAEKPEDHTDPAVSERMNGLARAWLKREDPKAQKLSGEGTHLDEVKADERAELNRKALDERKAETIAEYEAAGLRPLTIGRIPISIELARIMGVEPTAKRETDAA